ncbi:hypothetical protein [Pseudomonas allii]|uniref:hypothetical protein n=1 Tax=Pseudomonas allii TaxID=2740531 RepID=UPI001F03BCD8|nr:hypothetical protein [Pseudomonas allii]
MNGWLRPLRRARLRIVCTITCALLPLLAPAPASAASDAQSCVSQLVFDPTSGGFLPVNNFGTEQAFLNCFGWQLFIAMNWPVNPGWPATRAWPVSRTRKAARPSSACRQRPANR